MNQQINKKAAIKWGLAFLFVLALSQLFFSFFSQRELQELVTQAGVAAPIFIICFIALSEVLAPIPGSPAVLASLAIFGWEKTLLYSYAGLMIAVVVNFFISRIFGRKFILHAFDKKTLEQIDEFTLKEGKTALVISRTLGYPFSDFVSYASGLTNMRFSTYFVISAVCLGVSHFLFMLLFRHLNFDATQDFVFWFLLAGIFAGVFGLFLKKYYK